MPELNARYRAKHGHGPSGPREPASALCFHGDDADVTVVSKSDRFQFNPSFIWIPFGKRKAKDVVFPVAKTFESHGVEFVRAEATSIDPKAKKVATSHGEYAYDYLVIATGYLNDFDVIPGLGPNGNAYSITSLDGAIDAAAAALREDANSSDTKVKTYAQQLLVGISDTSSMIRNAGTLNVINQQGIGNKLTDAINAVGDYCPS